MYDDDRPVLALAKGRVLKAIEIVARQRLLIARLSLAGRACANQAGLLRVFEENLAIFEEHLAFLKEHAP